VYLSRPAVVARMRLDELTGRETSDVTGFAERLLRALPGAGGAPLRRGSAGRLRQPAPRRHLFRPRHRARVHRAVRAHRRNVSFGRTVSAGEPGLYDLIVECPQDESPDSTLPASLLEAQWIS
jgi:cyanophycin synthetase